MATDSDLSVKKAVPPKPAEPATAPAPAAPPVEKAKAVTRPPAKVFGDEMSNGKLSSLKVAAAKAIAGPSTVSLAVSTQNEGVKATSAAYGTTPTDQQQRTRAEQDYFLLVNPSKQYPNSFILGPQLGQGLFGSHQNEPTYTATLVALLASDMSLGPSMGQLYNSSPSNAQVAVNAVQTARDQGVLPTEMIQRFVDGQPQNDKRPLTAAEIQAWREIGAKLNPPVVSNTKVAEDINTAQVRVQKAKEDTAKLDELLQQELSHLGPALTTEERAAYTNAYREKYASKYAEEEAASKALAETLASPATQQALVNDKTGAVAKSVVAGYQTLATTTQAKASVDFAESMLQQPLSPQALAVQNALGGPEAVKAAMNSVLEVALPNAFNDFMKSGKTFDQGFADFRTWLAGKKAFDVLNTAGQSWQSSLKDAEAALKGNYDGLKKLGGKFDKMSGFAKGLAVINVVAGAMGAQTAAQQGDYAKTINGIVGAAKGGLELVLGATESMVLAGKFGPNVASAGGSASFVAKIVPGLNILANGLSAYTDLRDGIKKKRIGLVLAGTAELIAAGFGFLGPETAPVQWFATSAAAVIKFFDAVAGDSALYDEKKALLTQVLGDPKLAELLAGASPQALASLRDDMGWSPTMIQSFATRFPGQVNSDGSAGWRDAARFQKEFGLSGTEMFDLMMNGLRGEGEVDAFLRSLASPARNATEFREQLEAAVRSDSRDAEMARRVLTWLNQRAAGSNGAY